MSEPPAGGPSGGGHPAHPSPRGPGENEADVEGSAPDRAVGAEPAPGIAPDLGGLAATATATGSRAFRNASFLTVATISARLFGFVLGVVIARELGVEEYGVYGLALALGLVIAPLADLGMHQYLNREAARHPPRADALLRPLLRAKLMLTVGVLVLAGLIAALVVDSGLLLAAILLLLLASLLDGVSQFAYSYLQGRELMGYEAGATTGAALARSVGAIALILGTGELLVGLAWVLGVSVVQATLAVLRLGRPLRTTEGPRDGASPSAAVAWRTVLGMGLIVISVVVYLRADAVLIGILLDERAVGLYTAAYTVMLGLQIVPWMVGVALTPVFARTWTSDRALFSASWQQGLRAVLVLSVPLSLATSLIATPLVVRIFGAEYEPAGAALAVLVWASPLAGLNTVVAGVLRGAGLERWLTAGSVAAALGNVAGSVAAIVLVGITGAAVVTVATEALLVATLATVVVRRGIVPLPLQPLARLAIAFTVLAGTLEAASLVMPFEAAAVVALVAYTLAIAAMRVVTRDDMAVVRRGAA